MDDNEIKYFLEAALLAAGRPLNIDQLRGLFDGRMAPEKTEIRKAIATLNDEYQERGIVVSEVASGFRMQVRASMADRLQKLWDERPPRYSRALFETLALIAYRQPITRGEIEEIRGVAVTILGVALVPIFPGFKPSFEAHGAMTAAVTPPLVVALRLAVFWRRYTAAAALATIAGGLLAIIVSVFVPEIIAPFAGG